MDLSMTSQLSRRVCQLSAGVLRRASEDNCDVQPPDGTPCYQWMRVSHVCHRWREVAIHTLDLWTDIRTPSPEFMTMLLDRSRPRPLQVQTEVNFDNDALQDPYALWTPLLSTSSRIHSLSLTVVARDLMITSEASKMSLPNIRALELRSATHPWPSMPQIIPLELPSLRSLNTLLFTLRAVVPLLQPSLRFLSLHRLHMDSSTTYSMLLDALAGLPNLKRLTIEDAFNTNRPEPESSWRTIALPRLQSVTLLSDWPGRGTSLFLGNLHTPHSCRFSVRYSEQLDLTNMMDSRFVGGPDYELHNTTSFVSRRLSGETCIGPAPPLQTLFFNLAHFDAREWASRPQLPMLIPELLGWSSVLSEEDLAGLAIPALTQVRPPSFQLQWRADQSELIDMFICWKHVPSLSSVRTFAIENEWPSAELLTSWALVLGFRHLVEVTTLYISGRVTGHLLHALRRKWPGDFTLFPKLETLVVRGFDFSPAQARHEQQTPLENDSAEDHGPLGFLSSVLRMRKEGDHNLRRLVLLQCRKVPGNLDALEKYVEEFEWDGEPVEWEGDDDQSEDD